MMAGDLLTIIREDYLDDASDADVPSEDARWSDAYLLRQISEAEKQACWRQDLRHLFDDETPGICQIDVTAGTQHYDLDRRILRLQDVYFDGQRLTHVTQRGLEAVGFDWRDADQGVPYRFFITGRKLTLERPPMTSGTLALAVWREPLDQRTEYDELEWPTDQEALAHWVCFRAFMRPDEDSTRPQLAMEHRALFESTFGPEVPAKVRADLLAYPDTLHLSPLAGTPVARGFDFCPS